MPIQYTVNGNTYSFDGSAPRDLSGGGFRSHFPSLLADLIADNLLAQSAQTYSIAAAASAASAASTAAGYTATSTGTSLTVSAGTKSYTASTGKQFTANSDVVLFRTSVPATRMYGRVTSYNSGTGAMVVEVSTVEGTGSASDWTIVLAGQRGATGIAGGMPRRPIAGADTVLATDTGKFLDLSGTTYTLAFQACATLGADSWYLFRNLASGNVILDPNSSEQINGANTYVIAAGRTVLVQCDGTALRVVHDIGPRQTRYPIFSAEAAARTGVTVLEDITPPLYSTLLSSTPGQPVYGNSLFLIPDTSAAANISTSPDGITWTLRTMPSSLVWMLGTNGTDKFLATSPSSTSVANSTNGTTWAAATALPGITNAGGSAAFIGANCLVRANAASTAYASTNNGSSWTTQTLPAAVAGSQPIRVISGLFWYYSSGTTAYTSATGATGSWTARTLPITPSASEIFTQTNGALSISTGAANAPQYETTDGINWTSTGINVPDANATAILLNGVRACLSTTFGESYTRHNGLWVRRVALFSFGGSMASNGAGLFVLPAFTGTAGQIGLFNTAAITPTAIFEG